MLAGLLIGFILGLLIGPLLRSWLTWREYVEASREAQLTEDVLRRMSASGRQQQGSTDHPSGTVRAG